MFSSEHSEMVAKPKFKVPSQYVNCALRLGANNGFMQKLPHSRVEALMLLYPKIVYHKLMKTKDDSLAKIMDGFDCSANSASIKASQTDEVFGDFLTFKNVIGKVLTPWTQHEIIAYYKNPSLLPDEDVFFDDPEQRKRKIEHSKNMKNKKFQTYFNGIVPGGMGLRSCFFDTLPKKDDFTDFDIPKLFRTLKTAAQLNIQSDTKLRKQDISEATRAFAFTDLVLLAWSNAVEAKQLDKAEIYRLKWRFMVATQVYLCAGYHAKVQVLSTESCSFVKSVSGFDSDDSFRDYLNNSDVAGAGDLVNKLNDYFSDNVPKALEQIMGQSLENVRSELEMTFVKKEDSVYGSLNF